MERFKVIIADDSDELINAIKDFFSDKDEYEIDSIYSNGNTLLEALKSKQVDILLLDIFMPSCDGIKVLHELNSSKDMYKKPDIIIAMTAFANDNITSSVARNGADYLIIKPINFSYLIDTFNYLMDLKENDIINLKSISYKNLPLDNKITTLLHEYGVPAHIKGYLYIREAVTLMYNINEEKIIKFKDLYPEIARKFNTTSTKVERSIHHAILVAFERGNRDSLEDVFKSVTSNLAISPSNYEFITVVVEHLKSLEK